MLVASAQVCVTASLRPAYVLCVLLTVCIVDAAASCFVLYAITDLKALVGHTPFFANSPYFGNNDRTRLCHEICRERGAKGLPLNEEDEKFPLLPHLRNWPLDGWVLLKKG